MTTDLPCASDHLHSRSCAVLAGPALDGRWRPRATWRAAGPRENFAVGDFNKALEFDDASFDAVYAIQPMTYVSDHAFTFSEVLRVLKPGGRFVINDVAALDAYDRDDEHQRTLIQHTGS